MTTHETADYPSIEVDLSSRIAPAPTHWDEIDQLREEHRFFWNTYGPGYWVLTRFEDIREAFQAPETFCNHSIVATDPDPAYRFLPSFSDPPEHMKYRQVMNKWFAPAAVAKMQPTITRLARETVEQIAPGGGCEFMTSFADAYPVKVFLVSMGLPPDVDTDFFVSCVRRLAFNETDAHGDSPMMTAWNDIAMYWRDMIAERRARPLDPEIDFVTHLTQSNLGDRPLPDEDIQDLCVTLTIGSLDTLKSQLGWCFYHLATHDDDRRRVVADPELAVSAVEEFLRAYPIVSMARKLTRDVDFHGCPMKKDQMVLLSIQSATRDPRIFPDPGEVIIDRKPNRHIAFGASEHRCLGSHLARAELQTAITEWHRAIPEYRPATTEPLLAHGGQISLLELPLVWDGRSP
jgi:cytochrome P450